MLKHLNAKFDKYGPDVGLLLLRLVVGGGMLTHGYQKLTNFPTLVNQFPDVIGGGAGLNLSLAIFAEFFCSIAVVLGLWIRLATIPLILTMIVAYFLVHGADPFAKKELAFLYLGAYLTLFVAGGGKYALKKV